jgi:hypothetical protein
MGNCGNGYPNGRPSRHPLLSRGLSVNFGAGSTLYVNRATANALLNNLNPADFYGRRTAGLGTFNSFESD